MHNLQLIVRSTYVKNGKTYYYVYDEHADKYKRISNATFDDWIKFYFGPGKTNSRYVPSDLNDAYGYWIITPVTDLT